MVLRFLRGLLLAIALMSPVMTSAGAAPGACLPPSQAPRGLGQFLGTIRALTGGRVIFSCLRLMNGRYVYEVQIRVGSVVITKYIDASTGKLLP